MLYEAILFETPEDAMPVRRTVEVGEAVLGLLKAAAIFRYRYPRCEIISIKEKTESESQ